jgi:hypothetical protein
VSPTEARPGQEVAVSVAGLHEGCNDTGGPNEEFPMTDVPVVFVQGDGSEQVGDISSDEDFAGSATITIPADATPGAARVGVLGSFAADVTVLP